MNILHIAAHMGDGAGKAIGGLAILGNLLGEDVHRILLLDAPVKKNHIERCRGNGIEILERDKLYEAIPAADVVLLNWWGGMTMDSFLADFPKIPCRIILWSHKNGYYDPPLPDALVKACDYLLATSPFTLENPNWRENGALVYGFGDFEPEKMAPKTDWSLSKGTFTIGYIGTPSYKKLPINYLDYCDEIIRRIPDCRFILAGEASEELRRDIACRGMEQYFDFPGWVSNFTDLLRTFDVFGYLLSPATFATTENAVLEAMASAVPTVISKYPLGKYLLEDGVSGFLAESPERYGQIMRDLYDSEVLRQRAGEAGRMHVIAKCRADENLERFDAACGLVMLMEKQVHSFT